MAGGSESYVATSSSRGGSLASHNRNTNRNLTDFGIHGTTATLIFGIQSFAWRWMVEIKCARFSPSSM
jgi:hypothetical protein